jgi:hypothetical protein
MYPEVIDQSKPGPLLSRKLVVGDFNGSGHLGFFSANTGADVYPFSGELNSLFLWQNGQMVNRSDLLPQFNGYATPPLALEHHRCSIGSTLWLLGSEPATAICRPEC